jgi:hypothetical protein
MTESSATPGLNAPSAPGLERFGWALAPVLLAAVFWRTSDTAIPPLDTWSHWKYGAWIGEHRGLPAPDPFAFPDEVTRLPDTAWLSEILCYRVYAPDRPEALVLFFALAEVLKAGLYLAAFRRASGSMLLAAFGLAAVEAGCWTWSTSGAFQPHSLGAVAWAVLLVACARPPWPRWAVAVAPLAVLLWANLEEAFLLGVLLVVLFLGGRAWELFRDRRRRGAMADDPELRRLALSVLLALGATWGTPHGPRYPAEVLDVYQKGRQVALEWKPLLPLATFEGKAFVASLVAVLVVLRWSPRPFTPSQVLVLTVFALGTWFSRRLFPYWMSLCPLLLLPHVAAKSTKYEVQSTKKRPGFALCTLSFLLCTFLVVLAPSGRWVLGGPPRPLERLVRPETPLLVAHDLDAESEAGQPLRVFCSEVWGDYLLWELAPRAAVYWHSPYQGFSPAHLKDGVRLQGLRGGVLDWQSVIQKYQLDVLAVHNDEPSRPLFEYLLAQRDRPGAEWDVVVYESNTHRLTAEEQAPEPWGLVARRRTVPE